MGERLLCSRAGSGGLGEDAHSAAGPGVGAGRGRPLCRRAGSGGWDMTPYDTINFIGRFKSNCKLKRSSELLNFLPPKQSPTVRISTAVYTSIRRTVKQTPPPAMGSLSVVGDTPDADDEFFMSFFQRLE
ncbi:hypothetical protein NDU88_011329 [Pleurodeles waltl]|uniref:Uncharacterized protein n=1 Tax=Pleurodeles waltl TaxID=8319 RepID=A0AAV7S1G5_PLEWA|nr:hypothetical protein NDU88_011329 [Pleurodeles waltl]